MMKLMLNVLAVALLLSSHACARKKAVVPPALAPAATFAPAAPAMAARANESLVRVHFGFNAAMLTPEAKRTLQEHAIVLKREGAARIRIEGHADERGGTEYNLALSERRAATVLQYLSDLGVPGDRMTTLGMGEEKPLAPGSEEAAWSQNRRSEFRLPAPAERETGTR